MGTLNVSNINATGNLNLGGSWTDAPVGSIIKRGSYNTGYGSGSRLALSTNATWTTLNINGTDQAGMNIGKASDDVITFSKISNKSHLEITVNFPYFILAVDNANSSGHGVGIRCKASYDDGSNYVVLGNLVNGPGAIEPGVGGYGGHDSGVVTYTFSTYDNSTARSSWLAKTGEVRFYFEVILNNYFTGGVLHIIDYEDFKPREGTVQISEIITE